MKVTFIIHAIPGELELIDGLVDDMTAGVCDALRKWRKHVNSERTVAAGALYEVKILALDARPENT